MMIRGARIRAWLLAAMAGVLCFAPVLVASDGPQRGNPHAHFRNPDQCPKCHLSTGSRMDPGRISAGSDAVCLGCHARESIGRFHPIGVRPDEKYVKMKVPPDLRLSDDSRLVCLTCHTAHGPYESFFLRRSGSNRGFDALCEACHGKR